MYFPTKLYICYLPIWTKKIIYIFIRLFSSYLYRYCMKHFPHLLMPITEGKIQLFGILLYIKYPVNNKKKQATLITFNLIIVMIGQIS